MDNSVPAHAPRVLVVEDDDGIQGLLLSLLADEGYEPVAAETRSEVAAAVAECAPAVVLLDIHLPDVPEGIVEELNARVGWTPLIAMSASSAQERSESLGAYAFLPKPFDLDDVVRLVRQGVSLFDAGQSLATPARLMERVASHDEWSGEAIQRMVRWAYPEYEPQVIAPAAVLVADAESHYVDANRAAVLLLGYTVEALRQKTVADVVAYQPEWTAKEWARYQAEGEWVGVVTLRRKDGTTVRVQAQAKAVRVSSGPVYLSVLTSVPPDDRVEHKMAGTPGRIRTADTRFRRPVL
jgi:PAS domain S-box-containing protein